MLRRVDTAVRAAPAGSGVTVDLEVAGDTGGGANVGWVKAGEWLEYTINVATAGSYTFDARVAMLGAGGSFTVQLDGTNLTSFSYVSSTFQAARLRHFG